jgi:hypothetical protein
VIGMKLTGVANLPVTIKSGFFNGSNPQGTVAVQPGDILVGGGAFAYYTGAGAVLKETLAVPGTNSWTAQASDDLVADPSKGVYVYAFGVPRCPAGFNGCLTNAFYEWDPAGSAAPGAQPTTIPQPSQGWATTSVGGSARDNVNIYGRWLIDLIPETDPGFAAQGSTTVWTKDHGYSEAGWSYARSLVVRKQ